MVGYYIISRESRREFFKEVFLVGPVGRGQLVLCLHGALDPVVLPAHLLLCPVRNEIIR